jgi:hypothetical protein
MTSQQPAANPDGMLGQVLLELGKISTQVAVLGEQMKDVPDHEQRLRALETSKAKIYGAAAVLSVVMGGLSGWVSLILSRR